MHIDFNGVLLSPSLTTPTHLWLILHFRRDRNIHLFTFKLEIFLAAFRIKLTFRYSLAPALSAATSIWHFCSSRALYRIIKNGKVHFLSVSWTLSFCFRHPLPIGSGTPNIFLSLHVPYLKFFSTNPYFKPVTYHLFYSHLFPY